jgi:pimeloyl-ACP methyl ester carboxylesterase
MKALFKDERSRARILAWFDRFRDKLAVPTHSRTVTTRFGDTHVLVGGPEAAPSVVVLHGALASSAHALVELAPLLERFRVYAVDIVGQSVKSAEAQPSVANNDYGAWLVDVLDGLGLARTHVVGVSWGGFVAIRLAALAPERIERLVLLVPAGMVKGPVWAGMTKLGIPMMLYRMFPSERRLRAFTRHLLTTTDDDWMPYLGDAFLAYNLRMSIPALARPEELARLRAPTLVVGAGSDLSFPGDKLLARAPQLFPALAETELLADAKHAPPTTAEFRRWLGARISGFLAPG